LLKESEEQAKKLLELLKYKRTKLPNGLTVITKQMETYGLAHIVLGTRLGGSFFGPPQLFHLLEHLFGVPYRHYVSLDDTRAETNITWLKAIVATVDEKRFFKKFSKMVANVKYPEFAFLEKERRAVLVELGEYYDDPQTYLQQMMLKALYPDSNVASSPADDFRSVRNELTKTLLLHYFKKFFVASNLILIVVSENLLHEEICAQAESLFESRGTTKAKFKKPKVVVPKATFDLPLVIARPGLNNVYFALGRAIEDIPQDDCAAPYVVGDLFKDHINHILRHRYGLVYDASFEYFNSYLMNFWGLQGSCEAKYFDKVLKILKREMQNFRINPRHLEIKKEEALSSYTDFISAPKSFANLLYVLEVNHTDASKTILHLLALDSENAEKVRRRYFTPDHTALVVICPKPDELRAH
jgi:predicted Zn-dependent peptidase